MKINFDKYPLPHRLRHHVSPNLYLPVSELKVLPDYYPPLLLDIDWREHFQNGFPPNNLDVGCGKGKFLLDFSEKYPQQNILGIELRKGPADWLKNFLINEQIPNCSVLAYSVVNGLNFIADNSIEKIFYLFPDPWPKKKHHKRRAFNLYTLQEFYRVLKPCGEFYLATDVEEVHQYHLELLNTFNKLKFMEIASNNDWQLPITNKETFCILKNIPIFRIIAKKSIS